MGVWVGVCGGGGGGGVAFYTRESRRQLGKAGGQVETDLMALL